MTTDKWYGSKRKEEMIMKLINPAGSSALSNGQTIQPYACACSTKAAFANAKGSDGCFHCGCSCSNNTVNSGNASGATWTVRSSGTFE